MANEISIVVSMTFRKGGAEAQRAETISVDVAGDAFSHEIQEIGTADEALVEGAALGTPGYVFIKNLDSTNFVEVGLTSSYTIKLKAGEVALFRADGAIFAKADTSACNVEYWIIED